MGKVTAIVSAYYAEDFLRGRLDNLLSQYPLPEIIVVAQMGSVEVKIAEEWNKLPEIKVVTTLEIPTIYAAWNLAIQSATGDFYAVANSDDLFYPGALKLMSDTLDRNPDIALCYGDTDICTAYKGDPVNRYVWDTGGFDELLKTCFIGPMPMWRASLHKYGLFDEEMRSAGDYEFWLRVFASGEKAKHIPQALGMYLARKDSAERREPLRGIWEAARARSRYSTKL